MALSKLNFNSLNLTPVAGKGIGFDSGADDLEASFSGGDMTFISKSTASSSSTISFTSGIDSTYKESIYLYLKIFMHKQMVLNFNFKEIRHQILIIINKLLLLILELIIMKQMDKLV